ncbi:MAG: M15 family metallopeptidase [Bacteroidetes bacterium]|nr:M15 family metallopeptidase [Bacteroidota bacterium]
MSTRHKTTDEEIASLHPKIRRQAANCINELNNSQSRYRVQISNKWKNKEIESHGGYRSNSEQNNLYKKGRKGDTVINKKAVVTNAKGGKSYHNHGLAFDISVIENGEYIKDGDKNKQIIEKYFLKTIKKHGFEWGGEFKDFCDPPHIQKSFNYDTDDLIEMDKNNEKLNGYLQIDENNKK